MDGSPWTMTNIVSLGLSFGLSGFCYCLYKALLIKMDKLKNAPRLSIDEQLKDHLKETPEECFQYAVIEGAVQPLRKPLTSKLNEHVGVWHKYILIEHKQVWLRFSRSWINCDREVYRIEKAVPFVLVGADGTRVKVLQPLESLGLFTEMTHHRFHQDASGFPELMGQILSEEKIIGHLEIEEMLKVGTTVTGVGQLVLETDGSLSLGPPHDADYILTVGDFESVLSDYKSGAAGFKKLALAFTLVGAAVLLWVICKYYKRVKRQREADRQDHPNTNRAEEAEVALENLCVICCTNRRDCTLLDCGHVCCCLICYEGLIQNQCPICRQTIRRVVFLNYV